MGTFEPLDLAVLYVNPSEVWLSASSRLGSVNALRREAGRASLDTVSDDLKRFEGTVVRGGDGSDITAKLGRKLTDLVFGAPEIVALFQRTRGAAVDQGKQVLLRLLAAPRRAAALPWELLIDPGTESTPLVFAEDVHLVRMAQARTYPVRRTPITPPLQVLLVLSNPTTLEPDGEMPFDLYEERRALEAELRPMVERGLLEYDVVDRPTIESLRRAIGARERGYHVVHYLGHAKPTGLKLEDRQGLAYWTESARFNAILRACPDLRLAFFAGCRTAADPSIDTEAADHLLSVADQCVREACQTVVGMQAVLPFRAERVMTRFFYQALVAGSSIAQALRLARAAVFDDDEVGAPLLDWVVPALYTGDEPEAIVDTEAPGREPPPPRRRTDLKLDLQEPDREFFARQSQLRTALDVLSRRCPARVLWVTGPAGAGKSRLAARALDDVDDVEAVLYLPWQRLGTGDPVGELCELVAELVERHTGTTATRNDAWSSDEWWDRLIEQLADTNLVLAIDDVPPSPDAGLSRFGPALRRLVQRRTGARVALVAKDGPPAWLGLDSRLVRTLRVEPLSFADVWDWIRRNRPSLAYVGREALAPHYATLGPDLEAWADLDRALARDGQLGADIGAIAQSIRPRPEAPSLAELKSSLPPRRAGGPLVVAVAGLQFMLPDSPTTDRLHARFAEIVTALADRHHVGGRILDNYAGDVSASIATLCPIESPFDPAGRAVGAMIAMWLRAARQSGANIILLDYGDSSADARESSNEPLVRALIDDGALVIAAGGNGGVPSYPAWIDGVLAVGSVVGDGNGGHVLAPYAMWDRQARKPELFAVPSGEDCGLYNVIDPAWQGSSASAFMACAAAILVWATDRSQSAWDVRQTLLDTAIARGGDGLPVLDIAAAVAAAQQRLVKGHLESHGGDLHEVAATSGLDVNVLKPALDRLVEGGEVATHVAANVSKYQLARS